MKKKKMYLLLLTAVLMIVAGCFSVMNAAGLSYNVAFNANGGKASAASKQVEEGSAYGKLPAATRTGYKFAGWYTKISGGSKVTAKTKATGGDYTLYAHWKANTYKVRYNKNGGTGTMSAQSMKYGTSYKLRANAFKKKGYTFAGWAASKNGKAVYKNKATVKNLTRKNGGTKTLYAVWKKSKSAKVRSTYSKAILYFKKGNFKKAEEYFKKLDKNADEACVRKMPKAMKKAYLKKLKAIIDGHTALPGGESLVGGISAYYLTDIDKDGRPEMIVRDRNHGEIAKCAVYSYANGKIKCLGWFYSGYSDFYYYPCGKGLIKRYYGGYMDKENLYMMLGTTKDKNGWWGNGKQLNKKGHTLNRNQYPFDYIYMPFALDGHLAGFKGDFVLLDFSPLQ